jgi:hypothetical protein
MDWIHLVHGGIHWQAVVNTVMNLEVALNLKFLTSLIAISFLSRTLLCALKYPATVKLFLIVCFQVL